MGIKRFSEYMKSFDYGNQDITGDSGKNNGLTHCWLSSSLKISPTEQLVFMNKLVENNLPVSLYAHEKTKSIMYQENLIKGCKTYGKTGNCFQKDLNENRLSDKQIGWLVGFVRKGERYIQGLSGKGKKRLHDGRYKV
jgi:beta-lactamase class D